MKTVVRILIIMAVFAVAMFAVYKVVSASGSSTPGTPAFERGEFNDGARPELSPELGERSEFRGEGGGWIFGLIKNVGIVAVIVILITLPKNMIQKKRRAVPIRVDA
jgi:hypothetical protein